MDKCIVKINEIETFFIDSNSISLNSCNSDLVLYYLYLYKLTNNNEYYLKAEKLIYRVINILNKKTPSFNFANGYSSTLWILKHAVNNNFLNLPSDFFDKRINLLMKSFSINSLKKKRFDFIYGGLGPCLYFLEDKDNLHDDYYKEILWLLEKISWSDSNGIFWKETIFSKKNENEELNFGLAHGIPSIIYFLIKLYSLSIEKQKTFFLVNQSINWLISKKIINDKSNVSLFPSTIIGNQISKNSRLAWCYGDLGIASIIWQAGKELNNIAWKQEAINIMLHASKRKNLKENGIVDAGICHGSSGIAHLFNRFYWETKMPIFKETANFWINETLKMACHKDGLAGYKAWQVNTNTWVNEYSLLEGIVGIGLVLLNHISDEEPKWDSCLLLS